MNFKTLQNPIMNVLITMLTGDIEIILDSEHRLILLLMENAGGIIQV